MLKIKNNSATQKVYVGKILDPLDEYTIPTNDLLLFASSDNLLTDLISGDAKIFSHDNTEQPSGSQAIDCIKDALPKKVVRTMGHGGDYSMRPRGMSGLAASNQTTEVDYLVDETLSFSGGVFYAENSQMGDTIDMFVVDKDNLLGFGAGTVLAHYVKEWHVMPNCPNVVQDVDLSQPLLAGLYFRVKYTNTHATNSVKFLLNLYSFVQG